MARRKAIPMWQFCVILTLSHGVPTEDVAGCAGEFTQLLAGLEGGHDPG
jgi:hypothetical protein